MIEVTYKRGRHSLTVRGHAYSGVAGHDLVCASASILAYTFVANVQNAERQWDDMPEARYIVKEGLVKVNCAPPADKAEALSVILDGIVTGFSLLADSYPDNISIRILK